MVLGRQATIPIALRNVHLRTTGRTDNDRPIPDPSVQQNPMASRVKEPTKLRSGQLARLDVAADGENSSNSFVEEPLEGDTPMKVITLTVLIVGIASLLLLLATSFAWELDIVKMADRALMHDVASNTLLVTTCLGEPNEIVRVGGQWILRYHLNDISARLRTCPFALQTDEVYVLVNSQGAVNELVFTKSRSILSARSAETR